MLNSPSTVFFSSSKASMMATSLEHLHIKIAEVKLLPSCMLVEECLSYHFALKSRNEDGRDEKVLRWHFKPEISKNLFNLQVYFHSNMVKQL